MKAKKIIIPIVIIISILAILGGTFAGLWFFTGVFDFMKPATKTTAEVTDLEKALHLENAKFSKYSDFLNEYKELSSKSSTSKFNVSLNISSSEFDKDVQNVINKCNLKMESNVDAKNKKSQNILGLYSGSSEILSLDIVTNDNKIGVGCKDLYDNYLTVSADDLADYIKKNMGDQANAEELEAMLGNLTNSKLDPYNLLYISDEDLQHFDETYRDGYKELISKEKYSSKDDVEIKVDGDKIEAKANYLTLTGKDCYNFVNGMADKVKNDSVLSRIITEKLNLILTSSGQKEIKESQVKMYIQYILDELTDSLEDIKDEEDSAVQFAVYTKNDKIVKIELNGIKDINEMDDVETLISYESTENKNILTIPDANIVITNRFTKNEENEKKGTLTVKYNNISVATLDYDYAKKDDNEKIDVSVNIPSEKCRLSMKVESKGNYKTEPVTVKGSFNFTFGAESISVNFDGTTELKDEVSVPELNSSNSIEILKLSETELQEKVQKISQKASEVLPSRLKLLGINMPTTTTTPSTTQNLTKEDAQKAIDKAQKTIDSIDKSNLTPEMQKQLQQNQELVNSLQKQLDNL